MRSKPTSHRHVRAVGCLAALLALGPPGARADDPPPPCVIMGAVIRAADGAPVPFANVAAIASRLGATTDDQGRFLISGVPAGRTTIRIQNLGGPPLVETLDLAPGDTVRRTYRLESPTRERFLAVRDSLTARGLWPPTLEPALRAHMRDALDVRVFRLDPEHPVHGAPPDPERRIGPWPIVAEAPPPARPLIDGLIETLRQTELYLSDVEGAKKQCGGFSPGIAVRFTSLGVPVDLLLCYRCEEFSISRDGRLRQTGDFEGRDEEFIRFAKRMFPRDPVIRKLGAKAGRAAR